MIGIPRAFVFTSFIHLSVSAWVTIRLNTEDIVNIFLTAKDKGRSNAEFMLKWSEETKADICRRVLTTSSVIAEDIWYLEKTVSNARLVNATNPAIIDNHYNEYMEPRYSVEPRQVRVGEETYDVFGFPCLISAVDGGVSEIYIADGYLEKTYALLKTEEAKTTTLSVMGFAELPPDRELAGDQRTLEELYYTSLAALQVTTILNWDEHDSLINPVRALLANERLKLCSLVFDAIHSDFGWKISGTRRFHILNFEHGPASFTVLEEKPPQLPIHHQTIRGIECLIGVNENVSTSGEIHFILVPDWLNKASVFVLRYSDSVPPAEQNSPPEAEVVIMSYVRKVSVLANKQNGIHITI